MITIKDSKKEGHEARSDGYTKLIDNYVNGIRRNTWAKFIMKMLFFCYCYVYIKWIGVYISLYNYIHNQYDTKYDKIKSCFI